MEDAMPVLNQFARRIVELENQVAQLEARNKQLLEALGSKNKAKVSDEFLRVYRDSNNHGHGAIGNP
jgi:hypothetical protein